MFFVSCCPQMMVVMASATEATEVTEATAKRERRKKTPCSDRLKLRSFVRRIHVTRDVSVYWILTELIYFLLFVQSL